MALHHNPRIVTDGLYAVYDAADTNSYVSGSTTWYDLVGGNNATLNNGAVHTDNNNGTFLFDGTDDNASAGNINLGNNGAISIWFKFNALPTSAGGGLLLGAYTQYILYSNNNTALDQLYHFMYYDNTSESISYVEAGHISNIQVGKWYNSLVTFNSAGGFQAYVDGAQTVNTTVSNFSSWRNDFGGINISGYRSETETGLVHFYNKHLTAQEVLQNYNATKTRFGL